MTILRSAAREVLGRTVLPEALLRLRLRRDGNRLILLFHRVLPEGSGTDLSPPGMVVSVPVFGEILNWIAGRFDLPETEDFLATHPAPLPRPSALVTFDDGWLDTYRWALPEMRRRSVPGICFVSVRHVEEGRLFWPERLAAAAAKTDTDEFRRAAGTSPPRRGTPTAGSGSFPVGRRWTRTNGRSASPGSRGKRDRAEGGAWPIGANSGRWSARGSSSGATA